MTGTRLECSAASGVDPAFLAFRLGRARAVPGVNAKSTELRCRDQALVTVAGLGLTCMPRRKRYVSHDCYWASRLIDDAFHEEDSMLVQDALEIAQREPARTALKTLAEPHLVAIDRVCFRIPMALKKRLENIARQRHLSLLAVLFGSWAMPLARSCSRGEVVIGTRWTRRLSSGELTVVGVESLAPLRFAVDEHAAVASMRPASHCVSNSADVECEERTQ